MMSMSNDDMPAGGRIRVVSYNVHACIGADGEFAPQRICDLLHELQADFIGVQELEDRVVGGERVSEYLARNLGMHACRGATLKRKDAHYGNLLLSSQPAMRTRMHDISIPGREPRGVIEAEFGIFRRSVRVLVTHFGLQARERRRQVDDVLRIAADGEADVDVLLGDFNEWRPGSYAVRALKKRFGAVPRLRTWPARRPALPLDSICIAPLSACSAIDVVKSDAASQASDHLPLVCDLRLPR
jgi:endonuclease/exonuclease/phosphatase family metal-dependent hydrolase